MSTGPLDGVRVLELSTVVLGPWACQILGDLGADVVKVEPPWGDSNRHVGPSREPLMGALFLTCNRNKRSIVVDLKQPAGREVVLALARRADVLVHNYRPGSLARLGLEYDEVRQINPRIVFCGAYGYSRRGPNGDRPAYDDSIQAASGLAMLSAMVDGEPRYVPTIVADKTTALAVVGAVLAALFRRERTGQGQQVEVPMFETMVSYLMAEHHFGQVFDPPLGQAGYPRVLSRDRRPFKTSDGYLAVLPYLDEHWKAFCTVAGRGDLLENPRYATLASRSAHIDEVYGEVARVIATRSTTEWLVALDAAGVPATALKSLDDVLRDDHLEATRFWQRVSDNQGMQLRLPGIPTAFSETPGSIRRLPPRLGEHSVEVLLEAGMAEATIRDLLETRVVVQADRRP